MSDQTPTPAAEPAPAATAPAPKPTAIIVPYGKIPGNAAQRAIEVKRRFGPILGVDRVYLRDQGTYNFLTGSPHCTIMYPKNHEQAGQHRYEWKPAPDDPQIQYGFLKPEPSTPTPTA